MIRSWRVVADPLDFEDEVHLAALHAWEKAWLAAPENRYRWHREAVLSLVEHHRVWGLLLRFRIERAHDSWRT